MADPVVWSISANGGSTVAEEYGYLTDIMTAYVGAEQRHRLRAIPLRVLEFSILCKGREARLAQALLNSIQDEVVACPQWHFGSPLTSDVAPGATLLPITDALDVGYKNGQYAIVWRDAFTWELFNLVSNSGSGLNVTGDAAVNSWPAGTLVFPARSVRLQDKASVRWESSDVLSGLLRWTMEQL